MTSPTQRLLEEALSLGAQGLRIAQTRLEMLSIDLQREKQALARQFAFAVTCGTSAALAAFACILWAALSFEPRTRFIALGVMTGVFTLVAIACGVQPHTLAVPPPPQVTPVPVHCVVPQSTVWPQLLVTVPHLPAQVVATGAGVQPHTLARPPPEQVTPVPVH